MFPSIPPSPLYPRPPQGLRLGVPGGTASYRPEESVFPSGATSSLYSAERTVPCTPLSVYSVRMTYEQLADFVQNRMRMSHIYQPVMLMTLLRQGGRGSTKAIARSILAHDQSQVEYSENVTIVF
jgi:hypothetical protein